MNLTQGPDGVVDTCFRRLIAGLGATTVRLAEAVLPVPAIDAETAPLVLLRTPTTDDVTGTTIEHVPPAATVPPARLTPLPPAAAVSVPPHVFVGAGVSGFAFARFAG